MRSGGELYLEDGTKVGDVKEYSFTVGTGMEYPQTRWALISEELLMELLKAPVLAWVVDHWEEGEVPVVIWGEPHTEEVTYYSPVVTIEKRT